MLDLQANGGDLWSRHLENKRALIDFIEERNGVRLKEDKLIIGFSRRAAPYKRSDFIFTDEAIIGHYLNLVMYRLSSQVKRTHSMILVKALCRHL